MNPLPIPALQILNRGKSIYAEVPSSRPELRKWVKLTPSRKAQTEPYRYVIQAFELLADDVAQEIDVAGLEENYARHEFDTFEAALAALEELAPGPIEWQSGEETDCPL